MTLECGGLWILLQRQGLTQPPSTAPSAIAPVPFVLDVRLLPQPSYLASQPWVASPPPRPRLWCPLCYLPKLHSESANPTPEAALSMASPRSKVCSAPPPLPAATLLPPLAINASHISGKFHLGNPWPWRRRILVMEVRRGSVSREVWPPDFVRSLPRCVSYYNT